MIKEKNIVQEIYVPNPLFVHVFSQRVIPTEGHKDVSP